MRQKSLALALVFSTILTTAFTSPSGGAENDESKLAAAAREIVEVHRFPGITVSIANTHDTLSATAGFANLETQRPITSDTPMLAASIGKTFVAATVMQLRSAGVIDLDARISNWLGSRDWFDRLPGGRAITVRHLLQHTSGLHDHVHMPAFAEIGFTQAMELEPESLIKLVLDTEPLFKAGNGWSYTDTGYLLLGLIVEDITGQSYEDVVQELFLNPMKLINTGPSNQTYIEGLARGYVSPASGLNLPNQTTNDTGDLVWNPRVEWTGGGLYSTSEDLAHWGHKYFSGQLLSEAAFAEIIKGVVTSETDKTLLYGLGLTIRDTRDWGTVLGHRGWIPGYVSSLQYYSEFDTAIVFQINTDVGIIDVENPVVLEIEERLAALVFNETE